MTALAATLQTVLPSGPAQAVVRGTNGKIVFASDRGGTRDIYVMNPDGSGQTRLTTNPATEGTPAWSPDGSKIAFESSRDGNFEIYVMNADGSNQTRLTSDPAADSGPTWSPDGKRIAFMRGAPQVEDIWVMNVDGSAQSRLTTQGGRFPDWSPDGSRIAFDTPREGNPQLYVMNADGSGQINISHGTSTDGLAAWSPDGTRLAFISDRDGDREIYTMAASGVGQTRLTNSPGVDEFPAWSPDGSKIVFLSQRDGNSQIYAMQPDGTGQTRLTNTSTNEERPDWGLAQTTTSSTISTPATLPGGGPSTSTTIGSTTTTMPSGPSVPANLRPVPVPNDAIGAIPIAAELDRTGAHFTAQLQYSYRGSPPGANFPIWIDTTTGASSVVSPLSPSTSPTVVPDSSRPTISDDGSTVAYRWDERAFTWTTSHGYMDTAPSFDDAPSITGDGSILTSLELHEPVGTVSVRSTNVATGAFTTIGPDVSDARRSRDGSVLLYVYKPDRFSNFELHRLNLTTHQDSKIGDSGPHVGLDFDMSADGSVVTGGLTDAASYGHRIVTDFKSGQANDMTALGAYTYAPIRLSDDGRYVIFSKSQVGCSFLCYENTLVLDRISGVVAEVPHGDTLFNLEALDISGDGRTLLMRHGTQLFLTANPLATGPTEGNSRISLTATPNTREVGDHVSLLATLTDASGAPRPDTLVRFQVMTGPDAGFTAIILTDRTGTAGTVLKGNSAGTDAIQAWLDGNLNGVADSGEPLAQTTVTWLGHRYVALGDSYSSGEGNPPFIDGTATKTSDPQTTNECHRSNSAYGPLVQTSRGAPSTDFQFHACSGAILADFTESVGGPGQWDAQPQLDAIAPFDRPSQDTSLVTLTIGGNDAGFGAGLAQCVRGLFAPNGDCRGTLDQASKQGIQLLKSGGTILIDTRNARWTFCGPGTANSTCSVSRLERIRGNSKYFVTRSVSDLAGIFGKTRDRAPKARILVVLYPHLFANSPPKDCTVGHVDARAGFGYDYKVSKDAADRINQLIDDVDRTIIEEVAQAKNQGVNVDYVETRDAFYGHGVQCLNDPKSTPSPWINGTVFESATVLTASLNPSSFHPNCSGQQMFAQLVERKIGIQVDDLRACPSM